MSTTLAIPTADEQAQRLQAVYAKLVQVLNAPETKQTLAAAKADTEWSVMEVLGHLVEMIPYWLASCQTILAADTAPNFGRSLDAPERLAGVERGANTPLSGMLTLLQHETQQGAAAIRQMSAEHRSKQGIHPTRGPMTVAEIIEVLIVDHAESHVAQIQTLLRP